jgi:hypothetical protein
MKAAISSPSSINKTFITINSTNIDGSYKFNSSEIGLRVDGASASVADKTFLNYQQVSLYIGHFVQPETYLRTSVKLKNKSFAELSDRDGSGLGASLDMFRFMDGANTILMFGLDSRMGFGLRFQNKGYQSVEAENLPARDPKEVHSILETRMGKGVKPNEDSYGTQDVVDNLSQKINQS